MAANGSLLVGAGHAPPAGTSLPPGTLRIAMDRTPTVGAPQEHCDTTLFRDGRGRSLIRRGRIAGHPCGPSGPRRIARAPCSAMDGGRGLPRPYEWGNGLGRKNPSAGLMEGRQGDFGVFSFFFCEGRDSWERSEALFVGKLM